MKVVTTCVGRAARETRTHQMAHVLETRLEDWDPENAAPASLSLLSQTLSLPTLPFVINVLFITSKQKPSKVSNNTAQVTPWRTEESIPAIAGTRVQLEELRLLEKLKWYISGMSTQIHIYLK